LKIKTLNKINTTDRYAPADFFVIRKNMNKLTKQEIELAQRINEVLFYVWDPIGVHNEPDARDEYDSYVPQVLSILKKENPEENLKQYLFKIAKEEMTLEVSQKTLYEVVELLIAWKEVLSNKSL
jgi:hypothetical protein